MRFVLVDRRVFWSGFGLSLVASAFAGYLYLSPPITAPSTSGITQGMLLLVIGPLLVAASTYPCWVPGGREHTVTSAAWPWKRLWPYTQLIPSNLWVLVAGFLLLAAGIVVYFVQFAYLLSSYGTGGTFWFLYGVPVTIFPWVFLTSTLWGAPELDRRESVRSGSPL